MQEPNEQTVLGFISWQVDLDEGEAVIYWFEPWLCGTYLSYELQLHPQCQRQGIGQQFMHVLEQFGIQLLLSKAMLTVFANNEAALKFYTKLGFRNTINLF